MNHYIVKPGPLQGHISIPPSKSQTLRAILFASMANGKSTIYNPLNGSDTLSMINACKLLGANISIHLDHLVITGTNGTINHTEDIIDSGNSGIVLRFCSAIGALSCNPVVVTGDYSIRHQRPMQQLIDGLSQLGAKATSMRGDGYAPIIITGPISPGIASISGEDSQPISALLIASAFAKGPITINVRNPGEKPWVAMTLEWFDRLGIPYENVNFSRYILNGNSEYDGFEYHVPGDLSTAAFPLAAAVVTQSELTIGNIDLSDPQGDKEFITILRKMGANITIDTASKTLQIKRSSMLHGISTDINNCIDALPILAVVACFAQGETRITGAAMARQKECNRIASIATELKKMGANIKETSDGLLIRQSSLCGAFLTSYHDHRMAMSLTVAALGASGESKINSIDCVSKTYPSFMEDFLRLKANISRFPNFNELDPKRW